MKGEVDFFINQPYFFSYKFVFRLSDFVLRYYNLFYDYLYLFSYIFILFLHNIFCFYLFCYRTKCMRYCLFIGNNKNECYA